MVGRSWVKFCTSWGDTCWIVKIFRNGYDIMLNSQLIVPNSKDSVQMLGGWWVYSASHGGSIEWIVVSTGSTVAYSRQR